MPDTPDFDQIALDAIVLRVTNTDPPWKIPAGGLAHLQSTIAEQLRLVWNARGGADWQPIETAPKDGTEILLTDGHYKRTGYWAKRIGTWSIDTVAPLNMPTHWIRLPLLPERIA